MSDHSPGGQAGTDALGDPFDEEVLIRPAKGPADPEAAPDLILAMTAPLLKLFVQRTGALETRVSDYGLYRVYQAFREGEAGPRLTLAGPFIGAPQAVMGLEKMIALGARRIWVTGWCGSLQPDLVIGDLVDPVDALEDEGTSQHYPLSGKAPRADEGLRASLASALKRRERSPRSGRLWSTDAVYRETRGKVQALGRAGVLAVDMEISALLTVAAYRGVRLAALLAVSDELFDLTWRPGFSSRALRDGSEAAVKAILEAVDAQRKCAKE